MSRAPAWLQVQVTKPCSTAGCRRGRSRVMSSKPSRVPAPAVRCCVRCSSPGGRLEPTESALPPPRGLPRRASSLWSPSAGPCPVVTLRAATPCGHALRFLPRVVTLGPPTPCPGHSGFHFHPFINSVHPQLEPSRRPLLRWAWGSGACDMGHKCDFRAGRWPPSMNKHTSPCPACQVPCPQGTERPCYSPGLCRPPGCSDSHGHSMFEKTLPLIKKKKISQQNGKNTKLLQKQMLADSGPQVEM